VQQYGNEAAARHLKQEISDLQRIYDETHGKDGKTPQSS
jgi:hypothetical protein